jgi:gas vesicle protein
LDREGNTIKSWVILDAFPVSFKPGNDLESQSNDKLIAELGITFEAWVEIKGEGGYIIVPPSAGYSIQQEGISYAPPALIAELVKARKQAAQSTIDALKAKVLSATDFHDSLAAIAARRSAQGGDQAKVQAEVLATLAASVASNPKHKRHDRWAKMMEDSGGELSRIVSSGHEKYNPHIATEKVKEHVADAKISHLASASEGFFGKRDPFAPPMPDQLEQGTSDLKAEIAKLLPYEGETIDEWPFKNEGYFSGQ